MPLSGQPKLPVGNDIRFHRTDAVNDGWLELPAVATTALSQYYGVSAVVLEFEGFFNAERDAVKLTQVEIKEQVTSAANLKKADLQILIFNADQTPPLTSAVYNSGDDTEHCHTVNIAEADYRRINELNWVALAQPNVLVTNGAQATSSLFVVVLSNETGTLTPVTGAKYFVRLMGEQHVA